MRIRLNLGRLLELISESKISQNHWAIRVGLSRGHWSNIVQGKHPYPSGKTRDRLLDAFGVQFEDLFHYEAAAGADAEFQSAVAHHYLLDKEIGQGGMGTVYLARDVRLNRTVAMKVVSDEAVSGIGIERFLREMRFTARLRHHHILPVFDAGEAAGFPYYVMPFIDGGSLRDSLNAKGTFSLDEVAHLLRGMSAGLQCAHDRQVLHCDVKPENILLSEDHPYVADFGIARAIHTETFGRSVRRDLDISAGTPAYVSPEQASCDGELDARADVYSLACIAFELLAGQPPFKGTRTMEIVAQRFVEIPSLRARAPHLPRAVTSVIQSAMSVDKDDRPDTAGAFAEDFKHAATSRARVGFAGSFSTASRLVSHVRARVVPKTLPGLRGFMDQLRLDFRHALRALRRSPGFALVTVLTLGLGIGTNTAIFAAADGILLEGLPFPDSDRVVVMREIDADGEILQMSAPNFKDMREQNRSLSSVSFSQFYGWQIVLGGATPVRATVERVGRDFLRVFEVAPVLGRDFSATENQQGGDPVVIVSHEFWQTHLRSDSTLGSHRLNIGETTFGVIGVMPPSFRFQDDPDIWMPAERFQLPESRTTHSLRVIGRVGDRFTQSEARRDINRVLADIRAQDPRSAAVAIDMRSLQDDLVGSTSRPLILLAAASGVLLLIACTNVASTQLARGESRRQDFIVRTALGAPRQRLIRYLLTECTILGVVGGLVGIAFAIVSIRGLDAFAPATLPRRENIVPDLTVMAFAAAITGLAVLLFGMLPALRTSKQDSTLAVREGSSRTTKNQTKIWNALMAAQVALAFVLVTGSSTLLKSFRQLMSVDAGFNPHGVLTIEYGLPASRYQYDVVTAFHDRLLTDIAALPGVTTAGIVNHLPLGGLSMFAGIRRADSEAWARGDYAAAWVRGDYRMASGGYFGAMGTPLVAGRTFSSNDNAGAPHAVVVNEQLADVLWPNENPIGKQVFLSGNDRHPEQPLAVVGVAANVRHRQLSALEPPTYYVHHAQRPAQGRRVVLAVRSEADPSLLIRPIQSLLRTIDRDIPAEFATMTSRVADSVARERFTTLILGVFAGTALILSVVGVYGVVSYTLARRTREFGIRVALGGTPETIRNAVIKKTMLPLGLGMLLGVTASFGIMRPATDLLFGVRHTDPMTYAVAVMVLLASGLAATWFPARRGTVIDPLEAMHSE